MLKTDSEIHDELWVDYGFHKNDFNGFGISEFKISYTE